MKIENEITGRVKTHTSSKLQIELWIKDEQVDFFTLDLATETVEIHVEKSTGVLLGTRGVYEGYIQLVKDLGLEMPSKWKKHWVPAEEWSYYSINQGGNVEGLESYEELSSARFRKENYNTFPTRELAEKGVNASKLERLMLLWQYANDCLFIPDWLDGLQYKYYIIYDGRDKKVYHDYSLNHRLNNVHFETSEQAKGFIKMYSEEIKKIMGIE